MHRRTSAALAPHGVTADQFVLLARLADEDAITQQELAQRAASDANTVGAMLQLLEQRGLVARAPHVSDRRAHCVVLTALGRRSFRQMMKDTQPCRLQMIASVKFGSVRGLSKNLQTIAQALEPAPDCDSRPTRRNARKQPGFD
jgi:DNA-binding MarR family transcriptional regulator